MELKDESGYIRIFGTFLGKVPKYGYKVSPVRWDTYFLVNWVENQKLNQTTAELPLGWVFDFQLGLRHWLIPSTLSSIGDFFVEGITLWWDTIGECLWWSHLIMETSTSQSPIDDYVLVIISYCVCRRPSWKQKTQPNDSRAAVWLSFWFLTRPSADAVTD